MVGRTLCIFALLVAFASAEFDCSQENTCFGESTDCNPDTSCKTLFRFDEQGNLDLYLRDFTEPMGYAAFPVKKHVNGTHEMYEYFMCIPNHGQLLRGFAELGQRVLITEQNFTGVEQLNLHDFLCRFNVAKLPKKFQQSHELSVSIGIFEKPHVIATGVQLHNLKPSGIPSTHYIGGSLNSDLSIFTPEDGDALTEAIQEMRSLSDTEEEDVELEKLARKVEKVKEEPRDEKEAFEHENTRDYKETRQSIKGRRQESNEDEYEDNTHRSKQSKSRASAQNEDQEEDEYTPRRRDNSRRREDSRRRNIKSRDTEEDEESEDEYTPRRRDSKKSRPTRYEEEDLEEDEEYSPKRKSKIDRHNKDDSEDNDELPRRRSTRKNKKISDDEDYYESEDDDDEDYDNSSKTSIVHVFFVLVLLRFI